MYCIYYLYLLLYSCVRSLVNSLHPPGHPRRDGVNAGVSNVWNSHLFHGYCLYLVSAFVFLRGPLPPFPLVSIFVTDVALARFELRAD